MLAREVSSSTQSERVGNGRNAETSTEVDIVSDGKQEEMDSGGEEWRRLGHRPHCVE